MTNSTERVPKHGAHEMNEEIRLKTLDNVAKYAPGGPYVIQWRLDALDREWDIERMVDANAGLVIILGLVLAAVFSWWLLLVPLAVAVCLIEQAANGWSPPLPILRRMGFRSRQEISYERFALKNLRGDFNTIAPAPPEKTTPERAEKALAAVEK